MMTVVPLTPNEPKLLKQVQNFYFLGIAQVFYGDESARSLVVEGTQGDATLRSFMNWDAIKKILKQKTLSHWRKLGQFKKTILLGAGIHKISTQPYTFSRTYSNEKIRSSLD
jgi:alpha-amylase